MESQMNNGMMGMGVEKRNTSTRKGGLWCEIVLRLLAFVFTLVAAVVLGVDKQTKVVPMQIVSTLPPLNVPVTAEWHYLSAFVFFVVANAIACAYAATSVILTLATGGVKKGLTVMIIVLDLLMVSLLFSSIGAVGAVGVIGYQGNTHVHWTKVCNVFDKFCHNAAAALAMSLLGSVAFLLQIALAAQNLQKKFQ